MYINKSIDKKPFYADIRLLVVDLDGTLLTNNDRILPSSVKALEKIHERGITVAVATGRPYKEAKIFIDKIKAFPYFIGMNSALTCNLLTGAIYRQEFLSKYDVKRIADVLDESGVFYEAYTPEDILAPEKIRNKISRSGLSEKYIMDYGEQITFTENLTESAKQVFKFLAATMDYRTSGYLKAYFKDDPVVDAISSLGAFVEILPHGCDKVLGVEAVCRDMQISMENVMAIGDSENDLELIRKSGIGVAMGNASLELKEESDWIVASNNENGIEEAADLLLKLGSS